MYDDDMTNTAFTAAVTAGAVGLSTWLSWAILAIVAAVMLVAVGLRLHARRARS